MAAITSKHRIARFEGSALAATFETGESQLIQDERAFMRAIRPLVQGDSSTSVKAYVGQRDRLIDTVTWSDASNLNATGFCPVRSNARYHRLRLKINGGFDRAMGADLDFTKEGRR